MKAPLLALVLFSCGVALAQPDGCVLKKQSDGIKVYTCKSEQERFKSLKAEFTIKNSTLHELETFLRNIPNYPTWQYNMASAEILKKNPDQSMNTRSVIDAPWPVENRELIVQHVITLNEEQQQMRVTAKTFPNDYPQTKGLVRVPLQDAEWIIKQVGTSLQVTYAMRIDPGGSIPAWLVNMAMAEGPYQTFTNLKKQLEPK